MILDNKTIIFVVKWRLVDKNDTLYVVLTVDNEKTYVVNLS